ncbi:MAG: FUSC family protein [Deltaproteobacteria bacterium]|nr:FUSC family protein [Deltaproteobacteria bacterium]
MIANANVNSHDAIKPGAVTHSFQLSQRFKDAFKIAVAIVITYAIALSQGWGTPFWAGFAVAFCGLTTVGDSLNKGLQRVFGTIFGASISLALLALCPQDRWAFMIALSLLVAFFTYMMGSTTRWYFWFMAGITIPIVTVTAEPDALFNFHRAIMRSQQTTLGIVVYSFVSVLVWPVSSRAAFEGSVRGVIGKQHQLFTHYMAKLMGAQDDLPAVQLRSEMTGTLGSLQTLLDHAELDTYEIWEERREWRGFISQLIELNDTMESWRQVAHDFREIDFQRYVKAFPEFGAELGARFTAIEGMLDGQTPQHLPLDMACEIDQTHFSELSQFQRSAVLLAVSCLNQLEKGTQACFDTLCNIRGFTAAGRQRPAADVKLSRAPLDPDRLASVLRVVTALWLAMLLYIYVPDLPMASALVILSTVVVMLQFLHPQASSAVFFWPLMFGVVGGGVAHIFIMPHLSGFLELGTMIFVFVFGLIYLFYSPRNILLKFMGLALFMVISSIDVEQHYSFMAVPNVVMLALMLVGNLLVAERFPVSFRAEDRFQAILKRFFLSCDFLLSTTGWQRDRVPSRWQRWRKAFHLNEVERSPQKLNSWARALTAAALGNATQAQIQGLVTSLQALSYRMNTLINVSTADQADIIVRELQEDVRSWRDKVQQIFAHLATEPEAAEYSRYRSRLDSMLEHLESRIEETLADADTQRVSAGQGESMYRLLGAHRGVSEALVDFSEQAAAIDWAHLRESRF